MSPPVTEWLISTAYMMLYLKHLHTQEMPHKCTLKPMKCSYTNKSVYFFLGVFLGVRMHRDVTLVLSLTLVEGFSEVLVVALWYINGMN